MNTVFVTLCDEAYFYKARQTVKDLRTRGCWYGDVVLITVDFTPPAEFLDEYAVRTVSFPRLDVSHYVEKIKQKRFTVPTNDGRELTKLTQWEKLHAFEPYFKKWERMVWVDAGLRILNHVKHLLALPWKGKFVAPDDCAGKDYRFGIAVELEHWPDALTAVQEKYGVRFDSRYFINCVWIHDTNLPVTVEDFLPLLEYPIWRHNEMGVMNAVLNFKHGLWVPFPDRAADGKFLFRWSDLDYGILSHWSEFCVIKYGVGIKFDI